MTAVHRIVTRSAGETQALAAAVSAVLPRGTVLLLDGELGGGKTTFVQGLARGLGLPREPVSPTFVLVREYDGLLHVDLYRLDAAEAASLAWDDYLDGKRLVAVEWSSRLPADFPLGNIPRLDLAFEIVDARRRRITVAYEEVPDPLRRRLEELWCG
ncbi:MAG: tRNA (adenosine(37)-N6)-threonylcarbamoyltransferase complex ATPase subunit type 1 TsaE [Candidatus Coatesbacteria bacterium]|nr:MAG: tRNA (adenosine(37)-N6)-threonylcarbamoyltransferase complex ATPase subunit type 1 TsaE [Candidatus Coatesbacteria bacterium]